MAVRHADTGTERPGTVQGTGDTTTSAARPAPVVERRGYPMNMSAPSGLVLLGALWLVVSRFVYDFPAAGSGLNGVSNGVFIGVAIAVIAIARMVSANSDPVLSLVNVVLGGWMIASVWVFGYTQWSSAPAWSDIITGAVVLAAALASWSGTTAVRAARTGPGAR